MRVGLDFDGVIADPNPLKALAAKEWHGIEFPAELFKKDHVVSKGLMTAKEYDAFNMIVCRHVGLFEMLPEVEGAKKGLRRLQEKGFKVSIISSRSGKAIALARKWLEKHEIDVPFVGTEAEDKSAFCQGLDVYVDDDLHKLKLLEKVVPNLYLFNHAYNAHEILENGTQRVQSWKELVKELTQNQKFTF